ncbi:FkbM family methyltransferase [Cyclobacterium marinum]|uniref:FkbM family methyltransferase n=1 Tax=Cyclobacterium marinum TaxID=104 RepID=UPI0030D94D25|tara:strand:+ start:44354 stop:45202 length:849 start_codon:yes stop_codon:yes gene_type:complete
MAEALLAHFTRYLYLIPGGYFIVVFIKRIIGKTYLNPTWRTFSFRGIKFKTDLSKQMGKDIFWRGAHDWAPVFTLEKILKGGQTFIDIGANQGEYTLWALKKVRTTGKVIAYEPADKLYNQLNENVNLNPQFKDAFFSRKIGLSDVPGRIKLYTKPGINEGVNSIYPSGDHDLYLGEIELSTLDIELNSLELKSVDCIKIDVEGAELNVLKGAKNTIITHRPTIITEINKDSCKAAGYEAIEILTFLKNLDYKLFEIGLRGKLSPLQIEKISEFSNIVAFPN